MVARVFLVLLVVLSLSVPAFEGAFAGAFAGDEDRAAELVRRALDLYRGGKNQEAAPLFLEAYELSKRPAQLRNAAKAYEAAGDLEKAEGLWERYRTTPGLEKEELSEAEASLGAIRERRRAAAAEKVAAQAVAAAEVAKQEAERARREAAAARAEAARAADTLRADAGAPAAAGGPGPWPWVTAGVGGAIVAAGAVMWAVSSSQLGALDEKLAQRENGLVVGTTFEQADSDLTAINTERVVAGVLAGVGAAVAAGGVAWGLFAPGAPVVAAAPGGGAAVSWSLRW